MKLSNYEKYSITEEEILQAKGDMTKIVNIERLINMTNEFDLVSFFESELRIATILITPNQVVISYGYRITDHSSLYCHMVKCIRKECLMNPMIEVRCVSNTNYGVCCPVLHSNSVILQEMKAVLIKIKNQLSKIQKNIMSFDIESFEKKINENRLQEIISIHPENIIGFSLSDYMNKLEIEDSLVYSLHSQK